jgi:enoyl-CoA hydratase
VHFWKKEWQILKGNEMSEILFEIKNGLGFITLNRPHALNALTLDMVKAMQQKLSSWRDDDTIKAVVVNSNSEKAFCAGGDVRWLYDMGKQKSPDQMQFFWHEYRLNHYIKTYPKPYLSLLNGITMGGGVGISLHGSYPVATENFSFAMPETGIGFFPDIGGGYLLSRCHGELGTYLGLCGKRIDIHAAVDAGLIKYSLESARLSSVIDKLESGEAIDAVLNEAKLKTDASFLSTHREEIDTCFAHDSIEDIMSALKSCSTEFARKTQALLESKSPTSLKVTLSQLRRAKTLEMGACMQMEYRMVTHFMQQHDFYEGVRALLVDKDKTPHWQPNVLSDVSSELIAEYFAPLDEELLLLV